MVGNYGVPSPTKLDKYGLKQAFESGSIHASALLVQVNVVVVVVIVLSGLN